MDRYDFLKNEKIKWDKINLEENTIKSDFSLALLMLKEILFYLLLFLPLLLGSIIFLPFNTNKSKKYLRRLIKSPFDIFSNIIKWFFSAKYTASLILFLIFMFIFQVLYLEHIININNYIYSFYDLINGNYISIFSSIFFHANTLHLLGNCLFLLVFGRIVEKYFGGYVILIFLFSGIIANLISGYISYLLMDQTKSLGASGGIAGLIIIAILLEPFSFSLAMFIPLPIFIIGWLAILSDILGLLVPSNINHMAHLSGYLGLIFIFFFLGIKNKNRITKGLIINLILIGITYLLIKFFGLPVFMNLIQSI